MKIPLLIQRLCVGVSCALTLGVGAYGLSHFVSSRRPVIHGSLEPVAGQLAKIRPELIEYRFFLDGGSCVIRVVGSGGSYVLTLSHPDSNNMQVLSLSRINTTNVSVLLKAEPQLRSIVQKGLVELGARDRLDPRSRDALKFLIPALEGRVLYTNLDH